MRYFESFPKVSYPYVGKLVDGTGKSTVETVDLSIRFKFIDSILSDPSASRAYYWKNGSRPDLVAKSYYGDENLAWIVMLSATAFDWIYDLPLEELAFEEYLKVKYNVADSNELATEAHHFETGSGYIIDAYTYANTVDAQKRLVSVYEFEQLANEAKRNIQLISNTYTADIMKEFGDMHKQIKANRAISKS